MHGFAATLHKKAGHVRIASIFGHAANIIIILLARVRAKIRPRTFSLADFPNQRFNILDAIINSAHRAIREARVAAALIFRRSLDDHDGFAGFMGGQRSAQA